VIVLGLAFYASRPKGSDADQVKVALDESIKASREGRPGGVLDKLSAAFQVNDQSVSSNQVASAIKKFQPSIEVDKPNPVVTDDVAHVISPMVVTVSLLGQSRAVTVPNVDIEFHKEAGHVWLIFPASTWRMTEIHLPPDALTQFEGFAAMGGL
jgi:hypothetical protein